MSKKLEEADPSVPEEKVSVALSEPTVDRHPPNRKLIIAAVIAVIFFSSLLALGFVARSRRLRGIDQASNAIKNNAPTVQVITARQASASSDLVLPGNIEANQVTAVNARTSGYLKKWYVDIGDRVRTGQRLADIDTPEVDEQVSQAQSNLLQARAVLLQSRANLEQARTNMEFARVTFVRYSNLVQLGVVTRQITDQFEAQYQAAKATVDATQAGIQVSQSAINANQANVKALKDLQGYKVLYAPFDGIVTARNVEVGTLIGPGGAVSASTATANGSTSLATAPGANADGGGASVGGLFNLARIDTLRIHVSVPQTYVAAVTPGTTAEITIRELPQRTFTGKVVRQAVALDQNSRTMLTEVDLPNPDFSLLPGMYAEVTFQVTLPQPPVRVPATALVIRTGGPQVLIVTNDHKLHYQDVTLGTDYGAEVDITQGVEPGSLLVANPTVAMIEGQLVNVVQLPANVPVRPASSGAAQKQPSAK
jgi:multidrug efflux pump subunit AcrA (membrane-fusion protein)